MIYAMAEMSAASAATAAHFDCLASSAAWNEFTGPLSEAKPEGNPQREAAC
jgi:hypothetical protein